MSQKLNFPKLFRNGLTRDAVVDEFACTSKVLLLLSTNRLINRILLRTKYTRHFREIIDSYD